MGHDMPNFRKFLEMDLQELKEKEKRIKKEWEEKKEHSYIEIIIRTTIEHQILVIESKEQNKRIEELEKDLKDFKKNYDEIGRSL